MIRSPLLLILAALVSLPVIAAEGAFFEPDTHGGYVARASSGRIAVDAGGLTAGSVRLLWRTPGAGVSGELPLTGVSSYFIGDDPSRWRTAVPHFGRVRVLPRDDAGAAVVVYPAGRDLEFDFEIPPGADPASAGIDFPENVAIQQEGSAIVLDAGAHRYRLKAPVVYQEVAGKRRSVKGGFRLDGAHGVSFSIGAYDPAHALVIDPVLEWLTYYGGSGEDLITAIATDSAGNVFIGGATTSQNLPWTPGGFEAVNPGGTVFITKLDPTGSQVLFSTFLGGESSLNALSLGAIRQISIDPAGNVYLCGSTPGANFPITAGAVQSQYTGGFAAKLDPTGSQLLYSTFLGAAGAGVNPAALAIDAQGNAYVGGTISGPQFIGTAGALQTQYGGGSSDGIVLALNAPATALRFGTLLGGSNQDTIETLALDPAGNIVIGGVTNSPDFPVTAGAPLTRFNGNDAGFVSTLDPTGSRLLWSTYIAGSTAGGNYSVYGMVVNGSTLEVCGTSPDALTGMGFPVSSQPAFPGSVQRYGFVASMLVSDGSPEWVSLVPNLCNSLAADSAGFLFMSSNAPYSPAGFSAPVESGGAMAQPLGPTAITMFSPDASQILYLSGVANAGVYTSLSAISISPSAQVWFAGYTGSLSLATTPGVVQPNPDPAPRAPPGNPTNPHDGFAGVVDLEAFRAGNFLAATFSQSSYTIRVGDPIVPIETLPVVLNGPITLTASANVPWLDVSVVTGGIQIQPNTQLTPGSNIPVQITISAPQIPGSQIVVSTQITVLAQPTFTLDTTPVAISVYSGLTVSPLPTRGITYNFAGQYYNFQTASSNSSWLFPFISSGPNNNQAQLSLSIGQMPAGTYTGTVTVSLQNIPNTSQTLAVTYTVLPGPTMSLSTTSVSMRAIPGQPPAPFTIGVSSSVANFPFSASFGTGVTWLTMTQSSQTAPCQVVLTASPPAATAPGLYFFVLILGLKGQPTAVINGQIEVANASGVSANPTSITYTYYRGATSNAPFPSIQLVAPQTTNLTMIADQPWIPYGATSFETPSYVTIPLGPFTMTEGTYSGNVIFRDSTGKTVLTVPVTLNLYNVPVLTFSTAPISFQYNQGDPPPAAQTLHISSPTIRPGYFSAGPNQFPDWVTVTPSYAATPADISIAVNPAGFAPGTYQQNVYITPQGSTPPTTGGGTVSVTLTVSPPAHPLITAIASSASSLPGAIAPGELVLIYGVGLGGASLSSAQLQAGALPLEWNGTQVTFDEFPAPVLFTSGSVIGVVAPFEIGGRSSVQVAVTYQGNPGPTSPVSLVAASPGIFTANESGSGQASAFTIGTDGSFQANNASNPVSRGSVVIMYVTGFGAMTPSPADGSIASAPSTPLLPVTAQIGTQAAQVAYVGSASGILSGVLQVNLLVPSNVTPGSSVPVVMVVGNSASQPGLTIAVK